MHFDSTSSRQSGEGVSGVVLVPSLRSLDPVTPGTLAERVKSPSLRLRPAHVGLPSGRASRRRSSTRWSSPSRRSRSRWSSRATPGSTCSAAPSGSPATSSPSPTSPASSGRRRRHVGKRVLDLDQCDSEAGGRPTWQAVVRRSSASSTASASTSSAPSPCGPPRSDSGWGTGRPGPSWSQSRPDVPSLRHDGTHRLDQDDAEPFNVAVQSEIGRPPPR